jgi:predicted dehydrogenase
MGFTRIGIIGTGIIAEEHLKNYAKDDRVKVVAACDIDKERLDLFCNKHNIESKYDNIGQLLDRDDIDAVDVCLHNNLHAPVAIEAMRKGKDVYCEKPMAGTYIDALNMYKASQEYGRKLHIQLAFIYHLETRVSKRIIDAQELGNIYHVRSTGFRRRGRPYVDGYGRKEFVDSSWSGGGALFDMGVYHISQLLYLLGNPEPTRISGRVYQETSMDPKRKEISKYNVEELGCGFVSFNNGLTMDVIESWAVHMNPFEGSSIMGSEGGIKLEPFSFYKIYHDVQADTTFNLDAMSYRENTVFYDEYKHYSSSQMHWISALRGEVELLNTALIALNTSLIQEGIFLSSKLGREVTSDEVKQMSVSAARAIPNLISKV